jgi:hypothetical protein
MLTDAVNFSKCAKLYLYFMATNLIIALLQINEYLQIQNSELKQ